LLQNLRLAEQQQNWANAQAILQALGEVYQRIGRKAEFKSLRQRALNQIGIDLQQAKAKGKDVFSFWMYLRGIDANEALDTGDLVGAKAIYQEILEELTALNDSSVNDSIAVAYHNLGMVVEEQRQFEEARAYYLKAMKIREDAGDFYHAANSYHQLGAVAEKQRQFEKARAYYLKAMQIREDAGDFYHAASDYHQLGRVAEEQRHFEEARAYYLKAMQIYEDAGDSYNAASEYHGLGCIAKEEGDFDSAITYFQKTFTTFSTANDWRKASISLAALGETWEMQENWIEATTIYIQALSIDFEHNQEFIGSDIECLGRMLKMLGESEFHRIWREVTNEECPEELFSHIKSASEQNQE
jgi:tetratricopeptide (TPR) repeat protein